MRGQRVHTDTPLEQRGEEADCCRKGTVEGGRRQKDETQCGRDGEWDEHCGGTMGVLPPCSARVQAAFWQACEPHATQPSHAQLRSTKTNLMEESHSTPNLMLLTRVENGDLAGAAYRGRCEGLRSSPSFRVADFERWDIEYTMLLIHDDAGQRKGSMERSNSARSALAVRTSASVGIFVVLFISRVLFPAAHATIAIVRVRPRRGIA